MEYALLIGVIIFLIAMIAYGYMRGLIKIVFSMVATIATIILAAVLTIPFSGVLKNTGIGDGIEASVREIVEEAHIIDEESVMELDFPKAVLEPIAKGTKDAQDAIQEYVIEELTDTIIKALTFLALTLIIYIVIRIIIGVLDVFSKLPIINGINKWAGAVIGLVQGLLFIWIASLILTAFSDKEWAQEVFRQINDNGFLSFIYNNNMVIWLVTRLL
ncbi:MAG: CvpA family protein [Lachnospiraceae bacterium]